MTTTDRAPTGVEDLVAAARPAVPVLAADAGRADRDRRLPAGSTAVLRDAGAIAPAPPTRSAVRTAASAGDDPLQRFSRDLHVGNRHGQFTPYLALENHAGALATAEQTQETRWSSTR